MIKKTAFGTIEILLTLLIVSIIFIAIIPLFQSSSLSTKNSVDNKNIQENINEQVNQIEDIKKQNAKMLENINQDY